MGRRMLPKLTPMIRNMIAIVDPIITGYSLYMITCDMVKSEIVRHYRRIAERLERQSRDNTVA